MGGLPGSVEDWLQLYFTHHSRTRTAERVLRALYAALREDSVSPLDQRQLAWDSGVAHTTVGRVISRMRQLGAISTSGGQWVAGAGRPGYALPLRYHPHWPPLPVEKGASAHGSPVK